MKETLLYLSIHGHQANQYAFLVIVAHYVTNKGQLGMLPTSSGLLMFIDIPEELLIDFQELAGEHSGENMAEAMWETMKQYNLIS